jgi:hypothetical protein
MTSLLNVCRYAVLKARNSYLRSRPGSGMPVKEKTK